MQKGYSGLLVLDKPPGITSRDAVDLAQQWFPRGTAIGHTGTLDPLATGVLVLCIGKATRLTEFVQKMPKTYVAGLRLGARSDTDDADGTVTEVVVQDLPSGADVAAAMESFVGKSEQVPPGFSAAKVRGRRAYELARRGQAVTLAARSITIHGIDIVSYRYPRLEIEVRCGKGTYIRALARDLGNKLGCGALIDSLRRTRVGPFSVEDAVPFDTPASAIEARLLPVTAALVEVPRITVDQQAVQELLQGRAVSCGEPSVVHGSNDQSCAAIDEMGRLIAIGKWCTSEGRFQPSKVFAEK